jgi:hypothetical protein
MDFLLDIIGNVGATPRVRLKLGPGGCPYQQIVISRCREFPIMFIERKMIFLLCPKTGMGAKTVMSYLHNWAI